MVFQKQNLAGAGTIAGVPVRCLSVEMQFRVHTGYELPERQIPDLKLLRERFGAERRTQLARVTLTSCACRRQRRDLPRHLPQRRMRTVCGFGMPELKTQPHHR